MLKTGLFGKGAFKGQQLKQFFWLKWYCNDVQCEEKNLEKLDDQHIVGSLINEKELNMAFNQYCNFVS